MARRQDARKQSESREYLPLKHPIRTSVCHSSIPSSLYRSFRSRHISLHHVLVRGDTLRACVQTLLTDRVIFQLPIADDATCLHLHVAPRPLAVSRNVKPADVEVAKRSVRFHFLSLSATHASNSSSDGGTIRCPLICGTRSHSNGHSVSSRSYISSSGSNVATR